MATDSGASGGHGRQRATRSDRRLLTPPEAAALLRVSPEWVLAEVRDGHLPHYRIGRRVRFSREMIQKYLDERLVPVAGGRDSAPVHNPATRRD